MANEAERLEILKMVQSKQISPEDGARLIKALKSMSNVTDPFLYAGIKLNTSAKDNFPTEQEILDKWAGGATGDFVPFGKLYEKVR